MHATLPVANIVSSYEQPNVTSEIYQRDAQILSNCMLPIHIQESVLSSRNLWIVSSSLSKRKPTVGDGYLL